MAKYIDMTGWIMSEHGIPDSYIEVIKKQKLLPTLNLMGSFGNVNV